uniref:Protein AATF n=1 Tax=Ciona savignyi TaxID=51511 RepID=H2YN69_CIOSA
MVSRNEIEESSDGSLEDTEMLDMGDDSELDDEEEHKEEFPIDHDDAGNSDDEIDSDEALGEDDENVVEMFKGKSFETTQLSKGQDTMNQLNLWESLLETRIKMQKLLTMANQMPRPEAHELFIEQGGTELSSLVASSTKSLNKLGTKLFEVQTSMLNQDGSDQSDDKEKLGKGKTFDSNQWNKVLGKRYNTLRSLRNKRLQFWYDKTRISSHKLDKSFNSFERSTVSQIEHILADPARLLKRTRTKRSKYEVLGFTEGDTANGNPLNDQDEEIFDDDDFYHQLLQKLIEQKSSSVVQDGMPDSIEMTRQFLKLQRLRTKVKKTVDTKASKGRKVRYHVHPKLMSFMAPSDRSTWDHTARNRLIKSIFGKISVCENETENVGQSNEN